MPLLLLAIAVEVDVVFGAGDDHLALLVVVQVVQHLCLIERRVLPIDALYFRHRRFAGLVDESIVLLLSRTTSTSFTRILWKLSS